MNFRISVTNQLQYQVLGITTHVCVHPGHDHECKCADPVSDVTWPAYIKGKYHGDDTPYHGKEGKGYIKVSKLAMA